jgi:hypothetical protein
MGLKFNRQFVIEHADITGSKSYFIADFHCFEKKLMEKYMSNRLNMIK